MSEQKHPLPYYAVIFTTIRTEGDNGYAEMASRMEELAAQQPGYLGIESARNENTREGITVSYWKDTDSIRAWKTNVEHQLAQKIGKEKWYATYKLRVCKVEREYDFGV
jgi:heme-degrading monooxygenase HmoA